MLCYAMLDECQGLWYDVWLDVLGSKCLEQLANHEQQTCLDINLRVYRFY